MELSSEISPVSKIVQYSANDWNHQDNNMDKGMRGFLGTSFCFSAKPVNILTRYNILSITNVVFSIGRVKLFCMNCSIKWCHDTIRATVSRSVMTDFLYFRHMRNDRRLAGVVTADLSVPGIWC
ncbi:MAG: hypothetical protein JZU65_08805 [Chlorobium sp.]|jgi:hypothetical protein|nr:hypothetical protein [Chlorobium sp.]